MGPVYMTDVYNSGEAQKAYILLYTCCTTRAVHLELQPKLDADHFIRSLHRTFSRVGVPQVIVSDNHKTFKCVTLRKFATSKGIRWKHILALAPHWGGFYERLNRIVKSCLKKVVQRKRSSYEELETVLCQIEAIMNSRPLCYQGNDSDETVITPSHLLFGRRLLDPLPHSEQQIPLPAHAQQVKNTIEHFWRRFQKEYLTCLRASRYSKEPTFPDVGDVVLVRDKFSARCNWPISRVFKLIKSADGVTRGAVLRLANGKTVERAINILHPTEVRSDSDVAAPKVLNVGSKTSRAAARTGELI